ncbi:MAG: ABC transporter substrate-binding protein [Christensenellales bacterium]|jgi:branched-chain amino acid transport system substrate-binding protein
MMRKRKYLAVLLVLLLAVSVAACQPQGTEPTDSPGATQPTSGTEPTGGAATGDPVKIGVITPTTGAIAVYGESVANAVKMAFDEVNAAGGVLGGRPIEGIFLDDKFDSTEAANAFNRLISEDVSAVIGSVTSGITAGLATLADTEGMLLLTPTATADTVTEGLPSVFRTCYRDSVQSAIIARFVDEELDVQKAGVLYASGDTYSSGMYEGFKAAAEALGIEVVAESTSSTTDTDFSTQLTNLNAAGVEVIFAPFYYDTIGPNIVPQARAAGYTGPMVGADGWDGTVEFMVEDKSLYNNTFFSNHYAPDDPNEIVQNFVKGYEELYGTVPNALSACGYDAAYMLVKAIEDAGSDDTAALIEAMTGMSFEGVTGAFTLDDQNTPDKPVAIIEYADGGMKWRATVTQ